jgi:hypothetical protein
MLNLQSCVEKAKNMDIDILKKWINSDEFFDKTGREHYRLLASLSTLYNNSTIIDIGTHNSQNALALSFNDKNIVHTFDTIIKIEPNNKTRIKENIKYHLEDMFDKDVRDKYEDLLLNSSIIFIDTHPHQGLNEYDMYFYLKDKGYKGIIIFDDIWYFKEMRNNLWYKIKHEHKYDLTEYGHWSGTGLVSFHETDLKKKNNDNWTLITAYFDLTKCEDASQEIKNRDKNYYLEHAKSTLNLDYNLVIYCDQENYERIKDMRPEYLKDKTKYVICEFDEFKFDHCEQTFSEFLNENRKKNQYQFDNRNTASYYLFCMSRYIMLKKEIEENHFNSTHFAWINFCIERMGYQNLVRLDEAFSQNRDKFSTCYIDYIDPSLISDTKEYFRFGRCSMCSGFFTGNKEYMHKVCDLIEKKFLQYLREGYGHADEQLYSPVFFENPELFEQYYGDYDSMITNYTFTYDQPEKTIYNFIRNSFKNENYELCFKACDIVWKSYLLEKCIIPDGYLQQLCYYYMMCKKHIQ